MARKASSVPTVGTPGLHRTNFTERLDTQIGESLGAHDTGKTADRPGALLPLSPELQGEATALVQRFAADYGGRTTMYANELTRLARKHGIQAALEASLRAIEENTKHSRIGFTRDMKSAWCCCMADAGIGA